MDRIWKKYRLAERLGARIVRYADDFVVLCRNGTEQSMAIITRIMKRLGLRLNQRKTRTVDSTTSAFEFLGFELGMRKNWRTGKTYPHVQPSRKSLQGIQARIAELTRREMTCVPLKDVIGMMNTTLRGWVGYFHYRNCSKVLGHVRWQVEERLRTHLRKRHKVRHRATGYTRFSSRELYEKYGLYKVPTTAVWSTVHVL